MDLKIIRFILTVKAKSLYNKIEFPKNHGDSICWFGSRRKPGSRREQAAGGVADGANRQRGRPRGPRRLRRQHPRPAVHGIARAPHRQRQPCLQ